MANTNQPPVFSTDIADQSDTEGDVVSLDADATDADLDTLTYTATGLPGGVDHRQRHGRHQRHAQCHQLGHPQRHDHRQSDGTDTDTDTFTWTVAEPVTGSALDFDGINDHVTFGAAPAWASRASPSRPGSAATARARPRAPAPVA